MEGRRVNEIEHTENYFNDSFSENFDGIFNDKKYEDGLNAKEAEPEDTFDFFENNIRESLYKKDNTECYSKNDFDKRDIGENSHIEYNDFINSEENYFQTSFDKPNSSFKSGNSIYQADDTTRLTIVKEMPKRHENNEYLLNTQNMRLKEQMHNSKIKFNLTADMGAYNKNLSVGYFENRELLSNSNGLISGDYSCANRDEKFELLSIKDKIAELKYKNILLENKIKFNGIAKNGGKINDRKKLITANKKVKKLSYQNSKNISNENVTTRNIDVIIGENGHVTWYPTNNNRPKLNNKSYVSKNNLVESDEFLKNYLNKYSKCKNNNLNL